MKAKPLRGIHVFWMVFAFFAVVTAVDAYFIVGAVRTFPGEQVRNSYVLGLEYNRSVERAKQQASLGWTAQAGLEGQTLAMRMRDAQRRPLRGLQVSANYVLAGQGGEPQELSLLERVPGEYTAFLAVDGPARIELTFEARRPGEPGVVFSAAKTVILP